MMSNVAEIASSAGHISAEKLAVARREAEMSVLKMNMDASVMIQQQMTAMMREMMPHLGGNVNITV